MTSQEIVRDVVAKLDVHLPLLPNFIRTVDDKCVDLADLDDASLRTIGAKWVEALVAKARERREARDADA